MHTDNEIKVKKSEILKKNIYLRAIELFGEKGFENVKITEICDQLGIAVGTFYYYYPSKEAVFLEYTAAADELMEEYAASIDCATHAERLKLLVLQKVKMFSVVGQSMSNTCLAAFIKHRDASSMEINRTVYVEFKKVLQAGIESGEFRKDLDIEMLTSTLRYVVSGLTLRWVASEEAFDIDKATEEHIDFIISAIKA